MSGAPQHALEPTSTLQSRAGPVNRPRRDRRPPTRAEYAGPHVRQSDGERLRVVWQVVIFLYPDGSAKTAHDFIGCPGSGGPYPG